jgi:hypothetical protein
MPAGPSFIQAASNGYRARAADRLLRDERAVGEHGDEEHHRAEQHDHTRRERGPASELHGGAALQRREQEGHRSRHGEGEQERPEHHEGEPDDEGQAQREGHLGTPTAGT